MQDAGGVCNARVDGFPVLRPLSLDNKCRQRACCAKDDGCTVIANGYPDTVKAQKFGVARLGDFTVSQTAKHRWWAALLSKWPLDCNDLSLVSYKGGCPLRPSPCSHRASKGGWMIKAFEEWSC
eukprot:1160696-Pelagomonas_calceolata.AAC.4